MEARAESEFNAEIGDELCFLVSHSLVVDEAKAASASPLMPYIA